MREFDLNPLDKVEDIERALCSELCMHVGDFRATVTMESQRRPFPLTDHHIPYLVAGSAKLHVRILRPDDAEPSAYFEPRSHALHGGSPPAGRMSPARERRHDARGLDAPLSPTQLRDLPQPAPRSPHRSPPRSSRAGAHAKSYSQSSFSPSSSSSSSSSSLTATAATTANTTSRDRPRFRGSLPFVQCVVRGVNVRGLVDSGAEASVVSWSLARDLGILHRVNPRGSGRAEGIGAQRFIGVVPGVPFAMPLPATSAHHATERFECDLLVMEDGENLGLIFGMDFLSAHGCNIDLGTWTLHVKGTWRDWHVPLLKG